MVLKRKIEDEEEENPHHEDDKPEIPHEDEGNWLVSYADMMTLLCGFFIMLFSMAKLDTPKYDSFKQEVVKSFGGTYVSPTKELESATTEVIQELGIKKQAIISSDSQGIQIVFESTVFFDTLSSDVTSQGKQILNKVVESIYERQKKNGKTYHIAVEGHTDSRPIVGGPYPSNWELSAARASRVVRMFLDKGFSPGHLTALAYADTHPLLPARTASGTWDENALAKNRRVVLRILEPGVDGIPFPEDMKAPPHPQIAKGTRPLSATTSPHATPSSPSSVVQAPISPHIPVLASPPVASIEVKNPVRQPASTVTPVQTQKSVNELQFNSRTVQQIPVPPPKTQPSQIARPPAAPPAQARTQGPAPLGIVKARTLNEIIEDGKPAPVTSPVPEGTSHATETTKDKK